MQLNELRAEREKIYNFYIKGKLSEKEECCIYGKENWRRRGQKEGRGDTVYNRVQWNTVYESAVQYSTVQQNTAE